MKWKNLAQILDQSALELTSVFDRVAKSQWCADLIYHAGSWLNHRLCSKIERTM